MVGWWWVASITSAIAHTLGGESQLAGSAGARGFAQRQLHSTPHLDVGPRLTVT